MKLTCLFFAIFLTIFLIDYKWCSAIKLLVFKEEEKMGYATAMFVIMVVASFLWAYYCTTF